MSRVNKRRREKLRLLRRPKTIASIVIKSAIFIPLVANVERLTSHFGYWLGLGVLVVGVLGGAFLVDLILGPTFPDDSKSRGS